MTEIQKFYNEQSIFITGGTGYLGKILIEKLLRSCPGIKNIYILVRQKKGKSIQERLHEMTNLPMFEPLKALDPNFEKKIVPLSGDVMDPVFGLSHADQELIKKEVSILFHAAATTRFDEPLKTAFKMNVESVKTFIDICKGCKNIKAIVYVSTAFSNCVKYHIEEKVYPALLSFDDLNKAVKIIEHRNFSEEEEETFTNLIIGKYPNTYCFTKAIAEDFISTNAKDLPISVYRFSIALSSLREPIPNWIDTAQAVTQTLIRIGKGIIRVLCIKGDLNMETVPIDLACNCLIATGYETGINKTPDYLQVYNYVSSRDNPVSWNYLQEFCRKNRYELSIKNAIYYPEAMFVKNWKLFFILHYVLHFIPAILGDTVFRIIGKKPRFYTLFQSGTKLSTVTRFFTNGEWLFETENVKSLWNKLSDNDKKLFNFDITSFTWDEMLRAHCLGSKKYVLHHDISPKSLKRTANRVQKLFYIHLFVRSIFYASILWLFWKLYCLLFNIPGN